MRETTDGTQLLLREPLPRHSQPWWWCNLKRLTMRLQKLPSIMHNPQLLYRPHQVLTKTLMTISQKKRKRFVLKLQHTRRNWSNKFTARWCQKPKRNRHERELDLRQFSSGSRRDRARSNYANRTTWSMRTNSKRAPTKRDKATIHGSESLIIVTWLCRASLRAAMIRQEWNKPC